MQCYFLTTYVIDIYKQFSSDVIMQCITSQWRSFVQFSTTFTAAPTDEHHKYPDNIQLETTSDDYLSVLYSGQRLTSTITTPVFNSALMIRWWRDIVI